MKARDIPVIAQRHDTAAPLQGVLHQAADMGPERTPLFRGCDRQRDVDDIARSPAQARRRRKPHQRRDVASEGEDGIAPLAQHWSAQVAMRAQVGMVRQRVMPAQAVLQMMDGSAGRECVLVLADHPDGPV